jgi:L-aminopeptidase/D-esterase-like protein
MRFLEARGIGYDAQVAKVPIVPAAILFDLGIGSSEVRPDAEMGFAACERASGERPEEGNAGAGMGATAGKILGAGGAMKVGIGTASVDLGGGLVVGAIVAANPLGDILDPETGEILAGARPAKVGPVSVGGEGPFADTLIMMKGMLGKTALKFAARGNTVIGVVATNAALDKEQANKVAQMAQDGIARAVRPAHTMFDGDTIFAMSTGGKKADVSLIGAFASEVVAKAIANGANQAVAAGGLPAARDLRQA